MSRRKRLTISGRAYSFSELFIGEIKFNDHTELYLKKNPLKYYKKKIRNPHVNDNIYNLYEYKKYMFIEK